MDLSLSVLKDCLQKDRLQSWAKSKACDCYICEAIQNRCFVQNSFLMMLCSSCKCAVQALKRERVRREHDGAAQGIIAETEEALLAFFIEGCRFEMQTGHVERAVASIQTALEYSCFAPAVPVGNTLLLHFVQASGLQVIL